MGKRSCLMYQRTQKDTEFEQTTREKNEQTPEFEKFKRKKK